MNWLGGFIKDYRKELDSSIWLMPPLYHRVWQWIKYSVNHQAGEVPFADGSKVPVNPGERITSHRQIAKGVGYYERGIWQEPNPKTIKKILEWLESEQMIAVKSNSKYTLIKVLSWQVYQSASNSESNSQATVRQQSLGTNKNEKNDKNDKKYKDTVFSVLELWNSKKIIEHRETDRLLKAIETGLKKYSYEDITLAINRYSEILKDSNYFYSHKFTLANFLKQFNGVPAYLDDGQQWANYNDRVKKGSTQHFDDNYEYSERSKPATDFFGWEGEKNP